MFDAPAAVRDAEHAPACVQRQRRGQPERAGRSIYELAYARYKDPLCLELLSKIRQAQRLRPVVRRAEAAVAPEAQQESANYPRTGYAILAKGTGRAGDLALHQIRPARRRTRPSRQAQLRPVREGTDDGSRPRHYSLWVAHRPRLVQDDARAQHATEDEESQKQSEGRAIAFGSENGVDYAICDAGPICDGVRFTRTAALVDENLIVFIDQIVADKKHTFDLAYHQAGVWESLPRGRSGRHRTSAATTTSRTGRRARPPTGSPSTSRSPKGLPVTIGLAGGEPSEVITATGRGTNITDRVPVVIFRNRAREISAAWYISLDGKPARIERLPSRPHRQARGTDVTAVAVTRGDKTRILVANPKKQAVRVSLPDGSDWRVARRLR